MGLKFTSHSTLPSCTLSYCLHHLDLNPLLSLEDLIATGHLVTHLLQEAFILLFLKPACLSLLVVCLFVLLHPCWSTRLRWPRPSLLPPTGLSSMLISQTCQSHLQRLLLAVLLSWSNYNWTLLHEIIAFPFKRVLGFSHAIVCTLPNSSQTGLQVNKTASTA